LQANPDVLIQQGGRVFGATAQRVTNSGEALRVLHLFRRREPFVYDPLIARLSDRESVDERTLPDVTEELTIVRIDPNPGTLPMPAIPADLTWIPPAALVAGVVAVLVISLTRSRPHEDA
jgi:hypothetical protein